MNPRVLATFALAVLGLYAVIWGAELAFPRTAVSAVALITVTALGAWIVRPGWNLRPHRFRVYGLLLFGLLLTSAAAAAWLLILLRVPLPYDLSRLRIAAAAPAILLVTGIEELLFRQVMYRWLEQRGLPGRSAVVATTLAFAGAHLGPVLTGSAIGVTFYLLQSAYMLWIGALLGEVRRVTRSWPMAWLGHFAYNVAVLYVLSVLSGR